VKKVLQEIHGGTSGAHFGVNKMPGMTLRLGVENVRHVQRARGPEHEAGA
jgi:hypothetical protein